MKHVKIMNNFINIFLLATLFLFVACGEIERSAKTSYDGVEEKSEEAIDNVDQAYHESENTIREEAEEVLAKLEGKIAELRNSVVSDREVDQEVEKRLATLEELRDDLSEALTELEKTGQETQDDMFESLETSLEEVKDYLGI